MLARATVRAIPKAPSAARGFHATRSQMSSPHHYPEGPLTNIPFNPKSKWFPAGYWGFMLVGFGTPFGIAVDRTAKSSPVPLCSICANWMDTAWKESKAPEA